MEEARQKADLTKTAFREETIGESTTPANTWREQFYKAKLGRSSPTEEPRQRAGELRLTTLHRGERPADESVKKSWVVKSE
jgi:hypothetical protein